MKQQLRHYQKDAHAAVFDALIEGYTKVLYTAATGTGKCLGRGTPVLMYSGETKRVEDVEVGDLLIGPDSKPRRVLSTCTGTEEMYRVTPTKGDSYVVNESHILSLKMTNQGGKWARKQPGGTIVNISVKDYLAETSTFRHCAKGWRSDAVMFASSHLQHMPLIDPYLLGAWLGDGTSAALHFTTADPEIVDYLNQTAVNNRMVVRTVSAGGSASTYRLVHDANRKPHHGTVWDMFLLYNLKNNKHIPHRFLSAAPWIREQVLAGLIDTDGSLTCNGYDLVFKSKRLAKDTVFLSRSLGYAAYMKTCQKTCCNNGKVGTYYRISLSGDFSGLPLKIARKRAGARLQKKNVRMVGITVDPIGPGDYYGFEIDGDGLFLLGDFTVTHNTTMMAEIVDTFVREHKYRVLAIAHRTEIVKQIYRRVRDHCDLQDDFDIGVEQAELKAARTCQVIAGNVATVRNANRLPAGWIPDVIIFDEAHRSAARSYRLIMDRFPSAIVIGTTATAKRTDKQALYALKPDRSQVKLLDKESKQERPAADTETVYQIHCYEYGLTAAVDDGWLVPSCGDVVRTDVDLSGVKTSMNAEGEVDFVQSQLVAALEKNDDAIKRRVQMAYEGWTLKMMDRPTIAFWPGVKTAKIAALYWQEQGHASEELNGESDDEDAGKRARVIEDFNSGAVKVLHNVGLFVEGIDVPTCSGIIAAAPTKSWNRYVQQVGRGGRSVIGDALNDIPTAEERRDAIAASPKSDCYVLDVVDVTRGFDLCALPAILDLPANMDLQGHTVNEAAKLMDEYTEEREAIIAECPFTYEAMKVRLEQLDLMRRAKSRTMQDWRVTERGYTYVRTPPAFHGESVLTDGKWQTVAFYRGTEIGREPGPLADDRVQGFRAYQDNAARQIAEMIERHQETLAPRSRGTLARLSDKELYHLHCAKFTDERIDQLGFQQAKAIVRTQREKYWKAKAEREQARAQA